MKKITLFTVLFLIAFSGFSQKENKFRLRSIDNTMYREIISNWSRGFYLITKIESGLDDNYSKLQYGARDKNKVNLVEVDSIIRELKAEKDLSRFTKNLEKAYSQICLECYQKEYKAQVDENIKNMQYYDYRQDWLYCSNLQELRSKSDSIASIAKRKFYFINTGSKKTVMIYRDAPKDSSFHFELYMWFDLGGNIGGNKDLEIEGEEYYIFSEMIGTFLDVFPFWKSYIDPMANIDEVANNTNKINSKIIQVKDKRISYSLRKKDDKQWHLYGRLL